MTATADRQMELTLPMVPDIEIAAARAVGNLAREMGMSSEHVERMLLHPNADGKPPLYCAYEKDAHWVIAAVRDICFTFNIRGERAQNVFLARNAKEEPGVGLTGQSNVEEVPKALAQAYERLGIDPKDVETAVNA